MSREGLEVVKNAVERFNSGDLDSMLLDLYAPAAVWHSREDEPDTGVYRGREAIREMARMWGEMFEDIRFEIDDFIDAGEFVVAAGSISVRTRASDAVVREPYAWATKVHDGKVVEVREYRNGREALNALGLSGQAMSQGNVEVVREHFGNTNARRFEAAMQGYDPGVVLVVSEDVAVDPGVYHGAEAVGAWFGSWFATFAPNYRLDVAELIPVDDAVVAAVDHRAVGRRSGVEVTTRYYNAYWIRQGKIVRLELFRERSSALEAVGASPQDAPAGS